MWSWRSGGSVHDGMIDMPRLWNGTEAESNDDFSSLHISRLCKHSVHDAYSSLWKRCLVRRIAFLPAVKRWQRTNNSLDHEQCGIETRSRVEGNRCGETVESDRAFTLAIRRTTSQPLSSIHYYWIFYTSREKTVIQSTIG